ncbi:RfaG Glycosyltransferase [Burkholderiales bacterium]
MPTLYFKKDAFSSATKLMGRNVAGESFASALMHYGKTPLSAWIESEDDRVCLAEIITRSGRHERLTQVKVGFIRDLTTLCTTGNIFFPGPGLEFAGRIRSALSHTNRWSLTGIIHTISSRRAIEDIKALVVADVYPWDALVCTSSAGRKVVIELLQQEVDHLKSRLGIQKIVLPKLPVIPLGISVEDFSYSTAQKAAARDKFLIPEGRITACFVGRLTFHAKAHPYPMLSALRDIAEQCNKEIELLMYGQFPNDYIKRAYEQLRGSCGPKVRMTWVDGKEPSTKHDVLAASDLFVSLSDNIQETFGITPLEAMAAGLPIIVSDWNGYKDTVTHGEVGFRASTYMPAPDSMADLARDYELDLDTYDMHIGKVAAATAVDYREVRTYIGELVENKHLREQMGERARCRARSTYDWSKIIPQYEALWNALNEERNHTSKAHTSLGQASKAIQDPSRTFACFSSKQLGPDHLFRIAEPHALLDRLGSLLEQPSINYTPSIAPTLEEARKIRIQFKSHPFTANDLCAANIVTPTTKALQKCMWMLKYDLVQFNDENSISPSEFPGAV